MELKLHAHAKVTMQIATGSRECCLAKQRGEGEELHEKPFPALSSLLSSSLNSPGAMPTHDNQESHTQQRRMTHCRSWDAARWQWQCQRWH